MVGNNVALAGFGDGGLDAGAHIGGLGVGASISGGGDGDWGPGGGAGAGFNGGGEMSAGISGDTGVHGDTSGEGGDIGAGVNFGVGVGVGGGAEAVAQANSPPVTPTAGAGGVVGAALDVGKGIDDGMVTGGGVYLSHLGGAGAGGSGPACTVQGGPARILYFPPPDVASQTGSAGAVITTNSGGLATAQQPVTAWGQTFNPDYAYISVETLWATQNPSGTVCGSVVGPTFSNAIFPFRTSEISTQCIGTLPGYGCSTPAPQVGAGTAVDFGALQSAAMPPDCQVVAPPRFSQIVTEWSNGLFWNIHFEAATMVEQSWDTQPPPPLSGGQPCQGCPTPASSPIAAVISPTMVASGYNGIETPQFGTALATAPAGVSPNSFGAYAATATPAGSSSSYNVPGDVTGTGFGSNATATEASSTQPAQYTGAASLVMLSMKSGWSSVCMVLLLCFAAVL